VRRQVASSQHCCSDKVVLYSKNEKTAQFLFIRPANKNDSKRTAIKTKQSALCGQCISSRKETRTLIGTKHLG